MLSLQPIVVAIAILVSVFTSENTFAQSNHTVTLSGSTADFNAAERISAAASNTDYYVTFDATNLYIGAFRTSGSFGSTDNLTIYLDTDPNAAPTAGSGTTAGQSYNGVSGTLPFSANYNVHAEESYQEARSDASSWASTISGPTYHTGSTWREVAIPFSSIGNPDALYITMWMGYASGIYSNAPGADLGSGANPTVTDYIGGFGVSSADCIPVNTLNSAITASITDGVPASGATYGKVNITSANITATNNFNIAAGGSIAVSGGTLDISGRTIVFGGSIGDGKGTTVNYSGGTFTTNSATNLTFNGEGLLSGNSHTQNGTTSINRKFTPLTAGATSIGSTGVLDIRSGGFVNTNAVTYDSGSTLKFNTGSTYVASIGWATGSTSGAGVPHHVVIGDVVANSVLSFGTSSAYRHANGNVTVSNATSGNGLTLSTVAGGDLSLNGNFVQNGTFTHNSRAVTFSGSSAQTISGNLNTTGATNNFRFFIASNSGSGITFNSNTLFSGGSGDVMQLTSGNLNIAAGVTVTVEGAGGAIQVSNGTRIINFNAANSVMLITGSKTISSSSSGLLSFTSSAANGTLSLAGSLNFGNTLTTIGNNTYLEIASGGSVTTNPPTYAAGSTLAYNSGGTYGASSEWSTNTTSGSGVPSNVLIGNNTSVNFGASALYRHANRNVTISSGSTLVLSTVAGGDLQLRGDFAQNGTFTHNNRAVTFIGSGAQSITGSLNTAGASNNFAYLVAANSSGGTTLNTNVLVSQTTGDVLVISGNGALNIAATQTLTIAGNGGNIRVTGASRTINFNAASSVLNFTGTKTVTSTSSGLLSLTSSAANGNVKLAAAVNFGASLTTIGNNTYLQIDAGGSVATNAPTYASGSTLVYNTGGTITAATEWTANATAGVGVPQSVLIGNGVNTTLSFGASAQYRHAIGNVNIVAASGLTLSSAAGGNLQLAGNFANSGAFTHSSRDVTFAGTAAQTITGATTFQNLILNNSTGLSLNSAVSVANILTLTSGSLSLGSNDLTLTNTAAGAITGTFSSSRMIITNGNGQLVRAVATGAGTYNFPVGETTGVTEYSPASYIFTANSLARYIGVRVINANHPQLNSSPAQTDYISRYWTTSNSAAGTYTYTASHTFLPADLTGDELNIRSNMWNGASWNHVTSSSSLSNVLSITSGVTNATLPLGATAEFTGRVNSGATYVWNQLGTASFATAANWTPNRTTPAVNDILVFNNGATTIANAITTQTIGQLLVSGNTNVSFVSSVSATLNIAGGNGTDFSVAAGSTVQLSSTGANALTINFSNATTAAINGTFTINNNASLDNNLNCANSVVTVNGSLNNFGIVTGTAPTLLFGSTGIYRHNYTTTAGSIPVATWHPTSTCSFTTYTGNTTAPGNLNQTFGHFTWNCAGQTGIMQFNGALTSVAGDFSVLRTGSGVLRLANATTQTLNVGGNMTLSGVNTTLILSSGSAGKTTINVAGSYAQSTASCVMVLCQGNTTSYGKLYVGGNFTFSSGSIEQNAVATTGGLGLVEFNGSTAQTVTIGGSFVNTIDFRLNNTVGITLSGTIPINQNGTCYRQSGTLSGGTFTYNATSSELIYEGTSAMSTSTEFPTTNAPVNVTMSNSSIVTLTGSRSLTSAGVFTHTDGIFQLGNFDLTLNNSGAGALVNASPSASRMIATNGTGQLKRALPSGARDLQFYIGDNTGTAEYSPLRLNFTANSLANRIVGVRVVDDTSSVLSLPYAPIDYLSRHWVVTLSSTAGNYTYTPTINYNVAGDLNGTENNLQVAAFPSGASAWNHYVTNIASPSINTTSTLSNTSFSLDNAQFSGRTPVKYWNGSVSNDWSTAANWTPSGVPTSADNIDINSAIPNICNLASGSATVNHLTINQTGTLGLASGSSLTVNGNFTYVNTSTLSFDCNSTFSLTNTTFSQLIPAATYGHLSLGTGTRVLAASDTIRICGNYTPTSGSSTNSGSTVQFMGTATQSILSNATSFNNLRISNTTNAVSSALNVSVSGDFLVDALSRYNQTANTITIVGTGVVYGYLRNSGTVNPSGSLTFNSGSRYEHNFTTTAGAVPTSTWNAGSICSFIGYTTNTGAPTGLAQTFKNVVYDCQSQTSNVNFNGGITTVDEDLNIISSGSGQVRLTGNNPFTMNIGGNLNHSGGYFVLKSGTAAAIVNVARNFVQTGGTMDMTTTNNPNVTLNLAGNYSRTGTGNLTTTGSNAANGKIVFTGANKTITNTTSGFSSYVNFDVSSGSTMTLLTDLALNTVGSISFPVLFDVLSGGRLNCDSYLITGVPAVLTRVTISSGGTIQTSHIDGFTATGAVGTIQTDNRTYSAGGHYIFNATANQSTGNFWTVTSPTANIIANLTINNTGSAGNNTVTMNSGATASISGTLNFPATNLGAIDVLTNRLVMTSSSLTAINRVGEGHVIGELQRTIATGTNTYPFYVGTAGSYSPVSISYNTVSISGYAIAKANAGPHPNIATTGLSQTSYVNRWWSITNAGITSTGTANINAFSYPSADLTGGATSATLKLARWNGAVWSFPTFTTGSNLISGTALTNTTTYGQFFASTDCSGFTATITPSGSTAFCNGGSVDLAASANITGSTFVWSPGDGLSSTTAANTTASPTSTTLYTVTATSPQNCSDTDTITVTVRPIPTGAISGTATVCNGNSTNLSITLTGTGPWSGTLSSGGSFSGATSPIIVTVSPSSNTTYTITNLSDAYCSAIGAGLTGSAVITVNTRPTGVISGTATICNGTSTTLSIAVTGTGPWSGTLSSGAPFSGTSSPITVSVSPSTSETYTIATLLDANCTANAGDKTGSAVVTVNARPTGNIAGTQTICVGSSVPIVISVTGSGTISGTLNPGAIPFSGSAPTINYNPSPGSNTTYTIATLSDANCSATGGDISGNAIVTVTALPTASISGTTSVCSGSSVNINFTGTANAVVTYTINGGSNQTVSLDGSGNATVNSGSVFTNQTYALVSVSNGICTVAASGSAVLTKVDYPEADITGTTSICNGSSTTISFDGDAGAVVTYTINGGADQFITLNGSGVGAVNTGALASNTTYLLVSVSNGTCSQNIGSSAVVTVYINTYYRDLDGDGFGDPTSSTTACTAPVGFVADNTDCCDANADINPMTEWWIDLDGDGYGSFVLDNGCLSGVTCASGTWPAQSVPYYPAAHSGASYASDCNDSNVNIRPGATEICSNNIDENCNGLVDEGCIGPINDNFSNAVLVNLNNPNAIYPNCLSYTGSMVNSTVSPQGNSGNVAPGGGRDVWYKFVAPSTAVQVKVSPTGFDAVVELKSSASTQIDAENINTAVGGMEILNYGNLVEGQTYWLAVRNYHPGNSGNFNICVSPMMASSCAYTIPAGGFPLCNTYKAIYRGADSYTFSFTGTGGNAAFPYTTTSGISNGLIALSTPSLDLRYGGVYNVRVDANFNVFNGLGASDGLISVLGSIAASNCTGVTILAQPLLEVKNSLRCPASLTRTQYLIGTPVSGSGNACSATNYTFEFTQVSNCSGSTIVGIPFEVTSPSNTPYLMLAAAFPNGSFPLPNTGYWRVRVRPEFSHGHGVYGPAQNINVNGTSTSAMLDDNEMMGAEKSTIETLKTGVYPNPNNGEIVNVSLTGINEGNVYIRIVDAVGRIVYSNMIYAEHTLNTSISFTEPLMAGVYMVEFTINGKTNVERLLIER